MRPSEALALHRQSIVEAAERHGVSNVRVFGSAARLEDREGSDLDLLVDPSPKTSLFDIAGLELDLERILGVRVEVLTQGDLHPAFRNEVIRSAVAL